MTVNQMIKELENIKDKIGGDHEVPVVRINYGENDYIIPEFATIGNFEDQDGKEYKCALIGKMGGEEFTENGIAHYKWKPSKINI